VTHGVDTLRFFDGLADEMNGHPERFTPLGEADMSFVVAMHRPGDEFRVYVRFEGVTCTGTREVREGGRAPSDFTLEGTKEAWQAMFDDIVAHGRATGPYTINSLALMGDAVRCTGGDPMGLDKFSRFNQTLQEFFDGAARRPVAAASGG